MAWGLPPMLAQAFNALPLQYECLVDDRYATGAAEQLCAVERQLFRQGAADLVLQIHQVVSFNAHPLDDFANRLLLTELKDGFDVLLRRVNIPTALCQRTEGRPCLFFISLIFPLLAAVPHIVVARHPRLRPTTLGALPRNQAHTKIN